MSTRTFAKVFGIGFALMGVLGFVPPLVGPPHPMHPEVVGTHGQLLWLFPVNELHNLAHLAFGVWGFLAARSLRASVLYARSVAIGYGLLVMAGLIPGLNTLYGLVPLFGNDLWLHTLLAGAGAYFGWVHRNPATA